jgi:topoisomerase-4 subunit A
MTFTLADGLTVRTGGRNRTFEKKELADWIGKRSQAGRLPPAGFPRSNTFA